MCSWIRVVALIASMMMLTGCQSPDAGGLSDADRAAVRAQLDTYVRTALAGDAEGWGKTLAEDAVVMPPNMAPLHGRTAAVNWIKTFPKLTKFTIDADDISGAGDIAYARDVQLHRHCARRGLTD